MSFYDTSQSLLQLTFFEIGTPEKSYLLSGLKVFDILKFLFKTIFFSFVKKYLQKHNDSVDFHLKKVQFGKCQPYQLANGNIQQSMVYFFSLHVEKNH